MSSCSFLVALSCPRVSSFSHTVKIVLRLCGLQTVAGEVLYQLLDFRVDLSAEL